MTEIHEWFSFEGASYKNIYDFAKKHNLSDDDLAYLENTVAQRHPLYPALLKVVKKNEEDAKTSNRIALTVHGQSFASIADVLRYYNLRPSRQDVISKTWKKTRNVDMLIDSLVQKDRITATDSHKVKPLVIAGKEFPSVAEVGRYFGLTDGQRAMLNRHKINNDMVGLQNRLKGYLKDRDEKWKEIGLSSCLKSTDFLKSYIQAIEVGDIVINTKKTQSNSLAVPEQKTIEVPKATTANICPPTVHAKGMIQDLTNLYESEPFVPHSTKSITISLDNEKYQTVEKMAKQANTTTEEIIKQMICYAIRHA